MRLGDLRTQGRNEALKTREIGNILELSGDKTFLSITTDRGYRLVLDSYNMKRIADFWENKQSGN